MCEIIRLYGWGLTVGRPFISSVVFSLWCVCAAERAKRGLLLRVCVLCCCRSCESVSVLLCRDERKHWACWDVLPRSHFFQGRNYLVTRSWVADPRSDSVAQRRRREGSRGRFLVSWKRLVQISNSECWCGPFKDVFREANSFTPFIAGLYVCCHKAIICLNPLYYSINLSLPQLLPLLFSKHISWQSSLLTPHEPVIS